MDGSRLSVAVNHACTRHTLVDAGQQPVDGRDQMSPRKGTSPPYPESAKALLSLLD